MQTHVLHIRCPVRDNLLFRGYAENGKKIQNQSAVQTDTVCAIRQEEIWLDWHRWCQCRTYEVRLHEDGSTEFQKRYEDIPTSKIYMNNFVSQFIAEMFPTPIKFRRDWVDVCTIDIEASDEGFPEPQKANHPVISITLKQPNSPYHVWGLYDYNAQRGCDL